MRVSSNSRLLSRDYRTCLVPSLDGRGNGVEDNSVVESPGMSPAVSDFLTEVVAIGLIQFGNILKTLWILCHQGALPEKGEDVVEVILLGILIDMPEEFIL